MRFIRKNPAPSAFENWKTANNPNEWSALLNEPGQPEEGVVYFSKRELREALLTEQGYLCCYCQRRIENTTRTVIEHWFPRNGTDKARGKTKMFDYQNLMAACDGGESENTTRPTGTKPSPLWCDKNKKEQIISLSPLQPDIENRLTYIQIGFDKVSVMPVEPADTDAQKALNILNLNTPRLANLRGNDIAGMIFTNRDTSEMISIDDARIQLADLEQKILETPGGYLPEFCGVKLHFLRLISGRA